MQYRRTRMKENGLITLQLNFTELPIEPCNMNHLQHQFSKIILVGVDLELCNVLIKNIHAILLHKFIKTISKQIQIFNFLDFVKAPQNQQLTSIKQLKLYLMKVKKIIITKSCPTNDCQQSKDSLNSFFSISQNKSVNIKSIENNQEKEFNQNDQAMILKNLLIHSSRAFTKIRFLRFIRNRIIIQML